MWLTVSACACLIVGSLTVSDLPGMPPVVVAPYGTMAGGLSATRQCATGVFYYRDRTLVLEVRKPHRQRIVIPVPPIFGEADFQYCFGAQTARIGNALVAVDLGE